MSHKRPVDHPTTCRAPDCSHPVYARGLCRGHYQRTLAGEPEDLSPLEPRDGPTTEHLTVRLPVELIAALRASAGPSRGALTARVEAALRAYLS